MDRATYKIIQQISDMTFANLVLTIVICLHQCKTVSIKSLFLMIELINIEDCSKRPIFFE